jgi:hypoxanthine phosphoribosyltransferase
MGRALAGFRAMLPPHRVLVPEEVLAARVRELAGEVARALPEPEFVLAGVLTGSFVFVADLARELSRFGAEPRVELAWTALYNADGMPGADVRLVRDLATDVRGRPVLLVDDILDTGRTLGMLKGLLSERGPSWLRTCVLLEKGSGRADFAGFPAPGGWVFGYGLDTEGEGRGLPYLAVKD